MKPCSKMDALVATVVSRTDGPDKRQLPTVKCLGDLKAEDGVAAAGNLG